jgi:hypothetical protein
MKNFDKIFKACLLVLAVIFVYLYSRQALPRYTYINDGNTGVRIDNKTGKISYLHYENYKYTWK